MLTAWLACCMLLAAFAAPPPDSGAPVDFDIPAGRAARTLPKLSAQAGGLQVIFRSDVVAGVSTSAIRGRLTPRAALDRMLAGTPLVAVPDRASGAVAIVPAAGRRPGGAADSPSSSEISKATSVNSPQTLSLRPASALAVALSLILGPASAQQAPAGASAPEPEPLVLNPFTVDATRDRGYQAASTLAGTRIQTNLADIGSSVSVMTEEFLRDIGAINNESALMYALNTEVGGPRGNFSGGVSVSSQNTNELALFANPSANTRVRGLTNADNTRNYFLSDIPWDGYTVSRVDLQRGPNAILFGLGSPSGVVNAGINQAEFRNRGAISVRIDRFGSRRGTLDYNRSFLDKQLAARVAVLHNEQKFRQHPAFSDDKRLAAALRYRPKMLNRDGMTFEVSGNFEQGSIDSNRPRILPPLDQITAWWAPQSQGGLDRRTFNPLLTRRELDRANTAFYIPSLGGYRSAGLVADPLAGTLGFTSPSRYLARRPDGTVIDSVQATGGDGPFPQHNSYSRIGVRRFDEWAAAAGLPFADFGGYVPATLRDPSVFDFHNKLMDGDNKGEWTDWTVFDVSLTQTFFGDRLGYNLTAFRQQLDGGQWAALGWQNRVMVDINTHHLDGTPNPNVGRAFIEEELRDTNATRVSDRDAWRAQIFGKHDFSRKNSGFLAKLLGEHRLTAALSEETQQRDDRRIKGWNLDPASLALFTDEPWIEGGGINTAFRHYLSGDLRGLSSATGAGLGNMASPFMRGAGGPMQVRYFDNTWTAPATVDPAAAWRSPDIHDTSTTRLTQASNPANYRGWTTREANMVTFFSPQTVDGMSARDYLTSSAQLSDFDVESLTGVWQGYLWNKSIIGTYGYRKDKARSYRFETSNRGGNSRPDTRGADLDPARYNYSNPRGTVVQLETVTRSWSVAAHLNRLLGRADFLPANLSLYYNRGENFQPLAGRIDAFRRPLPPPAGETEEYSALVATKDQKYSMRVTRYETRVANGSSTGSIGNMWALEQTLGFTANMMRDFRSGRVAWTNYSNNAAEVARLQNTIAPAWFAFESELKSRFPDYVDAWMGAGTPFATDSNARVATGAPAGFAYSEDSLSKGWELEFIANPTPDWRMIVNASRTEAVRDQVPGAAFRSLATFVDEQYMTTDVGLAPVWWHQNTMGGRSVGPYASFRPDWLRLSALNGQIQPEVRKWRANVVTSYDFKRGFLRDAGIGGAYRWEDRSIIGYAPMRMANGTNAINLNAPYYGPRNDSIDLWLSYRRKLGDRLSWRVQLNVYNVFGKNELVPVSASVDADGVRALGTITPTSVIPMRASAFTIREGRSWALTNTIEF
jgi:outer membrane receptor protein involved in Fe transport